MRIESLPKLVSVKELAETLGVRPTTIYQWVNQRKIPYVKLGKRILFKPKDINRWIEKNTVDAWEF